MSPPSMFVRRHAKALLAESISDFRVTILNGARQSGKTTMLREQHARSGGTFVTLDDANERAAARSDPDGFLEALSRPVYVDEVQRAGDPFVIAIKAEVDRHPVAGSFVLSGSTRFLTVPTLSESLAGRAAVIELWPFSVAERVGASPGFIDRLMTDPETLLRDRPAEISRHEYFRAVCAGGFPEALSRRSARSRATWFSSYLTTVTQREVLDIARVRNVELLPRMFRLLATLTGQEFKATELARSLGIDDETVRTYLALFETVYLVHRLPAWSRNLTSRVKKRPKIHLTDTGLASWLLQTSADALARPGNSTAGALLETFVVNELAKIRSVSETEVGLFHVQDRDGLEVDCVLETPSGRTVCIEIKAARTVHREDFRHLATLRDRLGADFVAGAVLFTGDKPVPFGDRLLALPISLLWDGRPLPALDRSDTA